MARYTLDDLARLVDHTNLHPDATREDMEKLCQEAKDYHFKMVAINSVQSKLCSEFLAGTDIHTGAAIGFPSARPPSPPRSSRPRTPWPTARMRSTT